MSFADLGAGARAEARPVTAKVAHALRTRPDIVYFALAAFDVLTICAALLLNHVVTTAFENNARTSREWSRRLDGLLELQKAAQEADAPGNDVFYSHNAKHELARQAKALALFDERWNELTRDLKRQPDKAENLAILAEMNDARTSMDAMMRDSELIFDQYERGNVADAARGMATMDRSFGHLIVELEDAVSRVERIQLNGIERQVEIARAARLLELLIGAAIFVIICLVLLYGLRIGRTVRAAEAQRTEAIAQLEAGRQRLTRYADNVSHELRGPISKLRLTLEVLLRQERSAEAYKDGLIIGLEDCERLSSIVDGLLFLARAENVDAGMAVRARQLDAGVELALIRDFFSAAADAAGVRIDVEAGQTIVNADRALLQRAVSNLVSNALSHTPRGGWIALRAHGAPGGATIEVEDSGEGIAQDRQVDIFDRFQSTSSGAKADGAGLGLGLPITKAIAELHGGGVTLSSTPGKGTCVFLSFPAAPPMRSRHGEDHNAVILR